MVQTGLIFGLLLGAVLQDWHFNFARQIHNGLTKQSGNGLLSLIVIIVVESAIVAALLLAGVLTIPANPDYAPAATIVGSLLFGLGMWLAHGCIVDNFVQVGNGDLNGLLALLAFTLTLVYYNWGVLSDRLGALNSEQVSDDLFHGRITGFLLCLGILAVITVAWLVWARKQVGWRALVAPLLIGILAGGAFLANALAHSFGGFAIAGPLLSWYGFIKGHGAGIALSWGMYFTAGITIGAFLVALVKRQFQRRPLTIINLISSIVAGVLMGVGTGLSKGTLTSNGLVYTALFSVQGWLALVFIIVGYSLADWLAHRIKK